MTSALAPLFPDYVACAELHDIALADPLYPEEDAAIARAVDKRRREFALGRTCARRALRALGVETGALVPEADRSVPWPQTAWGSITHADGFCAAVAALRTHVRGIGVDAEVKARVAERLWGQITTDAELARLRAASERDALLEATRIFSAKESFYKAQFCVTRAWVGFHDAEVTFESPDEFVLTLLVDVADTFTKGTRFVGRYVELAEHVVTGLVIMR